MGVPFEKRRFVFRVTHDDKHDVLGEAVEAGNAAFLMSVALSDEQPELAELEVGEFQMRQAVGGDRLHYDRGQQKNVPIEYKVTRVE